jgi:AhpD family alkylhydroperoxidase
MAPVASHTQEADGTAPAPFSAECLQRLEQVSIMDEPNDKFRTLTRSVSAGLSTLRTTTPEVMKSFGELGRAATSNGVLDAKTKELIALALSVAARCDPCIGFHMQTLVKLGATRQEIDETLGVTTYMGGGPSLMYAANAVAAFDEFSRAAGASAA